jgi:DNA primase
MSHLCLYPDMDTHRLSLGGTSDAALNSFLERNSQIDGVSLCLDADDAGQQAAHKIKSMLAADSRFSHIAVIIDPPPIGKDYNEALLHTVSRERAQKQAGHRKDAGLFIE